MKKSRITRKEFNSLIEQLNKPYKEITIFGSSDTEGPSKNLNIWIERQGGFAVSHIIPIIDEEE